MRTLPDHRDMRLGGCGSEPEAKSSIIERKLLEARTILVAEGVSMEMAEDIQAKLLVMEKMDESEPITLYINSPGGHADSGFAVYDMLRFVKPPIRTVVNGICASAAVLIHLAAEKENRFTLPNSRFLIHQPSSGGQGDASDLAITAKQIIKLRERYNQIVAEACGQDPKKVLDDVNRDYWLDGAEAVEYGLACRVLTSRDEL